MSVIQPLKFASQPHLIFPELIYNSLLHSNILVIVTINTGGVKFWMLIDAINTETRTMIPRNLVLAIFG
jgi:hypothetical protein